MAAAIETALMSIKPRYAAMILNGTKTVELRRKVPRLAIGSTVLVYASSPVRQIVGTFAIVGVFEDELDALWANVCDRCGIERAEFDVYFAGANRGGGLVIGDPLWVDPVPIRVRPPQSWMRLEGRREDHRDVLRTVRLRTA